MTPADQPTEPDQRSLLVEADLTVGLPTATVRVHSQDGTLYIEARSFDALSELRAAANSSAVDLLRAVGCQAPFDLATPVVVRVRGATVARYRPERSAGRLAHRLAHRLGVDPFQIDFSGVLRAVGRRFRPVD